jgi:hypothetical protein
MPRTDHSRVAPTSVLDWRVRRLREAGLRGDLAARIAADPAYDLHELLGLIDRGCPPATAVRILAPLETPPVP